MPKVLEIERRHVEANSGKHFTLIDPNGMRWFGDCLAVDHGPSDYYAVTGRVSSGPAEWVGLKVVMTGRYTGSKLYLKPAPTAVQKEPVFAFMLDQA